MPIAFDPEIVPLLRIALATALGAAVGWERERVDRPAGLRTHMTVALAAALFTALAVRLAETASDGTTRIDPSRALQAVVTGVSFLGAGTIFSARGGETVKGLTTAASLLATAGVGAATALASYVMAVGSTVLLLAVLVLMRRFEPERSARDGDERAGPPRPRITARAPASSAARARRARFAGRWHRACFSTARRMSRHRKEATPMMTNEIAGKWKQLKGEVRKRWGKLTDDDLDQVEGSWEKLVGRLQERYGKSREAADQEAREFFDRIH